ncbi:hypothetical protein FE257_000301 [Aspergillus nanangensis]|uniref:Fe2OG dioxygenase domain-containing protein n=1 Tax=Aspergillus nanangensis TaxID=2582783 RepID=A0AAD4CZ51_ASPNN|nr:hypothetical protein FE257_000301 [Aspergillus nanangensis]
MTTLLENARIHSLPEDAFYIADFITPEEEELLLQKIHAVPLPRWTHLTHRRLQTWPSALSKSNTLLSSPLPPWLVSPIITPRFDALSIFADSPHHAPNHVLINEYKPGQGIMPHEDGATYHPLVATVSLGAPIVLDLYPKRHLNHAHKSNRNQNGPHDEDGYEYNGDGEPQFRILQERRSLLVTRGKLYTDFLHGIAERTADEELGPQSICNWGLLREPSVFEKEAYCRETRVSLTYRDVIRVAKLGNTMKFLGGSR